MGRERGAQVNEWTSGQMNRWTVHKWWEGGWMGGRTEGWMMEGRRRERGREGRWIAGRREGWVGGWINGWISGCE